MLWMTLFSSTVSRWHFLAPVSLFIGAVTVPGKHLLLIYVTFESTKLPVLRNAWVLGPNSTVSGLFIAPRQISGTWLLCVPSYNVSEKAGSVSVTVQRTGNLNQYAIVLCRTEQGTASSSSRVSSHPGQQDYMEYAGQVGVERTTCSLAWLQVTVVPSPSYPPPFPSTSSWRNSLIHLSHRTLFFSLAALPWSICQGLHRHLATRCLRFTSQQDLIKVLRPRSALGALPSLPGGMGGSHKQTT